LAQNSLIMEPGLVLKLEFLKILAGRENATIRDVASELGIDEFTVLNILEDLKKNYMLTYEKDKISWFHGDNPSKIKPWGWNYIYRPFIGSTMVSAKYHSPWSLIVSEYQASGYGRHGKHWISNLGGLWMTAKIEVEPRTTQLLSMMIPIFISRFLREKFRLNIGIKWPNDIIYREKKLAGFLIEGELLGNRALVYIGIGINVNNDPPLETATGIKQILGKMIPRNSLLGYIAGYLTRVDDYPRDPGRVQAEYIDLLETIGRRVKAVLLSGEIIGIARSITESGELIVETDTGTYKLRSGEVLELRHLD
jgi:BirA family biotin operon repressor/biotin-[acetyl-CoA-carboxylase] ligase